MGTPAWQYPFSAGGGRRRTLSARGAPPRRRGSVGRTSAPSGRPRGSGKVQADADNEDRGEGLRRGSEGKDGLWATKFPAGPRVRPRDGTLVCVEDIH